MKIIFITILSVLVITPTFAQDETGIYLTIECTRQMPQQKVMITEKQVCLAEHAIVPLTELKSISDLQEIGNWIWFDITLSDKAANTMAKLTKKIPSSTFAFVVGEDVFTTFAASELMVGRTFRFQGENKDKPIFSDIQKRLQTLIGTGRK